MEKQQHSIDEIFRQSLGDYREAPPAAAWDEVVRRLDQDNGRRNLLPWPWLVLSLMMIIGGAWFIVALYGHGTDTESQNKTSTVKISKHPQVKYSAPTEIVADRREAIDNTVRPASSSNTAANRAAGEPPLYGANKNIAVPTSAAEIDSRIHKQPIAHAARHRRHVDAPGSASILHNPSGGLIDTGSRKDAAKQPIESGSTALNTVLKSSSSIGRAKPEKNTTDNRPEQLSTLSGPETAKKRVMTAVYQEPSANGYKTVIAPTDTTSGQYLRPRYNASTNTGTNQHPVAKGQKVNERTQIKAEVAQNKVPAGPDARQEGLASQATALLSPVISKPSQDSLNDKRRIARRNPSANPMRINPTGIQQMPTEVRKKPAKNVRPVAKEHKKLPVTITQGTSTVSARQTSVSDKPSRPVIVAKSPALAPAKSRRIPLGSPLNPKHRPQTQKQIPAVVEHLAPTLAAVNPAKLYLSDKPAIARLQSALIVPVGTLPRESKSTGLADKPTSADTAPATGKPERSTSLSFAALAGYEIGMKTPVQYRISGAFRLLWHADRSLAIGIQPAIRYGTVSSTAFTGQKAYQRSVIDVNTFKTSDISPSVRGRIDTLYNYVIRETFDSIVVHASSAGGNFWEAELPLILSYRPFRSAWHVYGGPSLNFGGRLNVTQGTTQTYTTIRKDSLVESTMMLASQFAEYFGRSSLERYSTYAPPDNSLYNPSMVRLGYLVGLGYEGKRFIFDASLHQQISGYKNMAPALKQVYSSPSVRLSIGYLLFSPKMTQKKPEQ